MGKRKLMKRNIEKLKEIYVMKGKYRCIVSNAGDYFTVVIDQENIVFYIGKEIIRPDT